MKLFLFAILAAATSFQSKCRSEKAPACYKGRLEVKAICGNSTIKLLEGALDTAAIVAAWTDESTGKTHTNVFALGSPCTFPPSIEEGQEFYFTLDKPAQNCVVCQAYYPKPAKALSIKVLQTPCR